MNKIHKLNELLLSESFVQVNYSKGFKYIDKAGEILNLYAQEKQVPQNTIGVDGLTLIKPKPGIDELRVTSTRFWCHIVKPQNLGYVLEHYVKEWLPIHELVAPENVIRIGWRNYFILRALQPDDLKNSFEYKNLLPNQQVENVALTGQMGSFSVRVEINPLKQKKSKAEKAILFDVDLFTVDITPDATEVAKRLKEMKETLLEKMPPLINEAVNNGKP